MNGRNLTVAALLVLGCCITVCSQQFEPFGIDMGMPGVGECFPDLYRTDQYGSGFGYCPVMEAAARAGAQWVRLYVMWRWTEPQQGQFDWTGLDYMVNYARNKGMEVYFIPLWAPAWARGSTCVDCFPFEDDPNRRLDAGRAVIDPNYTYSFFYNLAAHFRDRVTYYGVWNEPDHLDMYNLMSENWNQHYLIEWLERYLFPAYNAVKAVDPNTFIHDGDDVPWCTGYGLLCHVAPTATTVAEKASFHTYEDITP